MSDLVLQYTFEPDKYIQNSTLYPGFSSIKNSAYGSAEIESQFSSSSMIDNTTCVYGNNSCYFDGNNYIFFPNFSWTGNSMTVSFWYRYPDGITSTMELVYISDGTAFIQILLYPTPDDNIVEIIVFYSVSGGQNINIPMLPNKWYLITAVFTRYFLYLYVNNVAYIFYNGLVFINTPLNSCSVDHYSSIGGASLYASSLTVGNIDDFRFYKTALSADQVFELYDRGTNQYYYKFGSGEITYTSQNAVIGNTAFGYPIQDTSASYVSDTNMFKIDTSTFARGTSSLYTMGNNAIFPKPIKIADASGITVSTWINPVPASTLTKQAWAYYKMTSASYIGNTLYNYKNPSAPVADGTMYGSPSFGTTPNDLQFVSSSSQYVQVPSFDLDNNGFSFVGWIRSNNNADWARIFDFGNGASDNNIYLCFNGGKLAYDFYPNTIVYNANTSSLNANTYFHLAFVVSAKSGASCTVTIYINKVVEHTNTGYTYPAIVTRTLNYIGKSNWATNPTFNGRMFDILIYNRALTATEIGVLYDNSGNSNLLSRYSGTNSCPVYSLNGNGQYRWNLHANFTSSTTYDLSFCLYSGANTTPTVSLRQGATSILNSDVSINVVGSPVATFTTGTWYHIVWVITPEYWKISINNTVSTLYKFAKLIENTIQLFNIPSPLTPTLLYDLSLDATPVCYYQGNFDELRMYNRAITNDEIQKLYNYGALRTGFYDASGNDFMSQYSSGTLGSSLTYYNEAGIALSDMFASYSETPSANPISFYSTVYDVSKVVVSSYAIGDTTTTAISQIKKGQVMATTGVTNRPYIQSIDGSNNIVYVSSPQTSQTLKGQTASSYDVSNGILTCTASPSFTGTAPSVGDLVFHTSIPTGTFIASVQVGNVSSFGYTIPDVSNSSFTIPAVTVNTIVDETTTLGDIQFWTFSGVSANMNIYVANNSTVSETTFTAPVLPYSPQYLIFHDSSTGGTATISQSLTFLSTGAYTLSFLMAGLSNIKAGHTLNASIAGSSTGALTATAHTWTTRTLTFNILDAGNYVLTFSTTNGGASASGMCLTAIAITQSSNDVLTSSMPYVLTLSDRTINIVSSGETVKWYNTSVTTFSTLTNKSVYDSGYKLYSATGYDDYVFKFGNVLNTTTPYVATGTFTPTNYSNGYYLLSYTAGSGTVMFMDISYIQILVVGGGGAGGGGTQSSGGGGGEGGSSLLLTYNYTQSNSLYNVTVGSGGRAFTNANGECGQASCFGNIYALGGNGGKYSTSSPNAGGTGAGNGGDGGAGGSGSSSTVGSGGVAYVIGVSTSTVYGGGGGGGNIVSNALGNAGGDGGGGVSGGGRNTNYNAGNVIENTGGGGGGGGYYSPNNGTGGNGGSGIVQIYIGATPDIPRDMVVSAKTDTTLTIAFKPSRRIVTSYILTAFASNGNIIATSTLSGSATSGVLNGLSPNTTYPIQLIAYNSVGESPPVLMTATTMTIINPPASIIVNSITNNSAVVKIVNTDQIPSAYYVVLTATGYTSPTYYTSNNYVFVTGLSPNVQYTVVATAVMMSQTTSATNATATFTTANAPDPVYGLAVSNTDTTSTYSFNKPSQTITSYSLRRDNLSSVYTTTGLVGAYRATPSNSFVLNNSMYSGSGPVADGFLLNSPTFTTGASSYFMSLVASSSQSLVLPAIDMSNTGFSVACYFRASAASAGATLFNFGQYDGSLNHLIRIYMNASGFLCYNMHNSAGASLTGGEVVISTMNINDTTFRHFAWTLSPISVSTCSVAGYLNGIQVYNASNISYPTQGITRASCYIGESSIATDASWNGAVSDIMIWDRTITPTEVSLLNTYKTMNTPYAICPAGLHCYYLCNGTDTVVSGTDRIIFNQAPTLNNALLFGRPNTSIYSTFTELTLISSKLQHAQLPTLQFTNAGFTYAGWLRSNNNTIGTPIFEFGNGINSEAFGVNIGNGVVNYYTTNTAGATVVSQNYTVSRLNDNSYNHFVITIGANSSGTSNVIVYWNGVSVSTNSLTYPVVSTKMYNYIGANYSKTPATLNGGIADIFVYLRPISQSEVNYLFGNVGGSITTTTDTSQTSSVTGTITSLTKNAYYGLSVVATNASGNSIASATQIYTPDLPNPPTALTAGSISSSSIQYTFTPPAKLPYWYDVSAVNSSTVAFTGRLYPATPSSISIGTGSSMVSSLPATNLGLAITAIADVRLLLYSLNIANGLNAIRIINNVWSSVVTLNVSYNIASSSATVVNSGLAMTPDARRCIITAGTYFGNGTADNFVYWADMTPVLTGTSSRVSLTRILDTNARTYSTVAVTSDGMRIVVANYGATGQVYWSAWNGFNYGTLSQITSSAGNYIGTGFSFDGVYLAYGLKSDGVYVSVWNGSTYQAGTKIGSIGATEDVRSIVFTSNTPYGIFITTQGTGNVAYLSAWNGTTFGSLSSANTTNYGTGINGWGATIDNSNNLFSYPFGATAITQYPVTLALTNITSNTVTGLTSGVSYTINMRALGLYGYSTLATLIASTTSATSIRSFYYNPQTTNTIAAATNTSTGNSWISVDMSNNSTPYNMWFNTGDFTVECWLNVTSNPQNPRIFSIGTFPTARFAIEYTGINIIWHRGGNVTTSTNSTSVSANVGSVTLNTWVHYAFSRVSSIAHIFVNGTCKARFTDSTNYNYVNSSAYRQLVINNESVKYAGFGGYSVGFTVVKGLGLYTGTVGTTAFTPRTTPLTSVPSGTLLLSLVANGSGITNYGVIPISNIYPSGGVAPTYNNTTLPTDYA